MPKHYQHIQGTIVSFFQERGVQVVLEASGARGPDITGVKTPLAGEAKHEKELCRDLHCAYWTNWSSTKQRFGGKTYDYRLAEHVPATVQRLSDRAKGWVAVICGQLQYMVRKAKLTRGWIVYENYFAFEPSLVEAAELLRREGIITTEGPEHRDNVGFLLISYSKKRG